MLEEVPVVARQNACVRVGISISMTHASGAVVSAHAWE